VPRPAGGGGPSHGRGNQGEPGELAGEALATAGEPGERGRGEPGEPAAEAWPDPGRIRGPGFDPPDLTLGYLILGDLIRPNLIRPRLTLGDLIRTNLIRFDLTRRNCCASLCGTGAIPLRDNPIP